MRIECGRTRACLHFVGMQEDSENKVWVNPNLNGMAKIVQYIWSRLTVIHKEFKKICLGTCGRSRNKAQNHFEDASQWPRFVAPGTSG
jgi:hypothetical protein